VASSTLIWLVLLAFSIGLLSNTSGRLLQSALYAAGDARTPTRYAIIRVVVAAAIGAVLMLQFDRVELSEAGVALQGSLPAFTPLPTDVRTADTPDTVRLGAVGLALAAGASSWLEFGLLRRHLRRRRRIRVTVGGGALLPTAVAGIAAAGLGVVARVATTGQPLVLQLLATGAGAGVAYLAVASIMGLREVDELRRLLTRRRGR
jgi:putative peptidoglycan lipid II flippase